MYTRLSNHLSGKARDIVRAVLEHVLAEESQIAAATRGYGWRVRGSAVQSLRRLFAEQGRQIERWLAEVAAQGRSLGLRPAERAAADAGPVADGGPSDAASPRTALAELLTLHQHAATGLRADLRALGQRAEEATMDLLNDLIAFHETTAWMLKLLLTSPEPARVPVRSH